MWLFLRFALVWRSHFSADSIGEANLSCHQSSQECWLIVDDHEICGTGSRCQGRQGFDIRMVIKASICRSLDDGDDV